jgi:hypothetical protein
MKKYVDDKFTKFERENVFVEGLVGPEGKHPNLSTFLETFHDQF